MDNTNLEQAHSPLASDLSPLLKKNLSFPFFLTSVLLWFADEIQFAVLV